MNIYGEFMFAIYGEYICGEYILANCFAVHPCGTVYVGAACQRGAAAGGWSRRAWAALKHNNRASNISTPI